MQRDLKGLIFLEWLLLESIKAQDSALPQGTQILPLACGGLAGRGEGGEEGGVAAEPPGQSMGPDIHFSKISVQQNPKTTAVWMQSHGLGWVETKLNYPLKKKILFMSF